MPIRKIARRALGALVLAVVGLVLLGIPVAFVGWAQVLRFLLIFAAIIVCLLIGEGIRHLAEIGWRLLFDDEE